MLALDGKPPETSDGLVGKVPSLWDVGDTPGLATLEEARGCANVMGVVPPRVKTDRNQGNHMTARSYPSFPSDDRPFAKTIEKSNAEYANGKEIRSHFPYHEIRSLPGYTERETPGLAAVDVTNELARHLSAYAELKGCSLLYRQRDISQYLWVQASRRMLVWNEILSVVRAAQKRDPHKPVAHYFGYAEVIETNGTARDKKLIKLTRYVTQEGECAGCQTEFPFDHLTLDRIKPGKAEGDYQLANVQLMCEPCNNLKGASYDR